MRVLLAEYTSANDPALAPEGVAMRDVLAGSFRASGLDVVLPENCDFSGEISRLAPSCDMGLVIAPDHLLAKYTMLLESLTHNLGCGALNAALCANKKRTADVLRKHGIPVPADQPSGRRVVKPIQGCGSGGVRMTEAPAGKDEIAQEFIKGENLSVSIIASRVVGEACLYFSGNPPLVLAVNRQDVSIDRSGAFHYNGGETPVHPDREAEVIETARKAISVLGCQGYCGVDIVLADKPYVVDVNPRVTTSIAGIAAVMEEEVARLIIDASKGEGPSSVHLDGRVRYDKSGKVTRV